MEIQVGEKTAHDVLSEPAQKLLNEAAQWSTEQFGNVDNDAIIAWLFEEVVRLRQAQENIKPVLRT